MTRRAALLLLLPTAAIAAWGGCAQVDRPSWRDGLVADSPCYRVDLADGLDEADPVETEDLFDCLDRWGHLESLRITVAAARAPSPGGGPATLEIARAVNALPRAGVSPAAALDVAVALLRDPGGPLDAAQDLALEAITGSPAPFARAGAVSADDPGTLEAGLLAPLAPAIPAVAEALLAEPELVEELGAAVQDADRAVRWVDAIARSPHPDLAVAHRLAGDAGALLLAARSGDDLWPGSSGDSARDLVEGLTAGRGGLPGLDALQLPLWRILADEGARDRALATLDALSADRTLDEVPRQLGWLSRTGVNGSFVQRGELSGLEALARLLDGGNQPMVCTIDLGLTELEFDLGNLSVTLLEVLADVEPGTVQTGAGIVGEIAGWGLSQSLLTRAAESGACSALTPALVSDLRALDLLFEPEADGLVRLFLAMTRDLEREGLVAEEVRVFSALWRTGNVRALAELMRDTSAEPAWDDLVALVPPLLHPTRYGLPADSLTFGDAWDAAESVLRPRGGITDWDRAQPAAAALLSHDGAWIAIGNAAALLDDGASRASDALRVVPDWVAADPNLALLDAAGALLAEPDLSGPVLRLLATEGVVDAALATRPQGAQEQVPLAFAARLVTEGAVDDLLDLVGRVLDALEEPI
jgi:hypothetical protein